MGSDERRSAGPGTRVLIALIWAAWLPNSGSVLPMVAK